MKNFKDEFVMVPLHKFIADGILKLSDKLDIGPTEILNSGMAKMLDVAFDNLREIEKEDVKEIESSHECCDCVDVAEEVSDDDAKEFLLDQLKEVINTAHSVEIIIHVDKK